MRDRRIAAICLVAATASGCADLMPNWWVPPGTADYQARKAQFYDPYPLPDYGPDVVGGRPREAIRPRSENAQVQTDRSFYDRFRAPSNGRFQPAGPPPAATLPAAPPTW